MKPKKRQKMCFNCEGAIDLDVIVCPYCAADLREEKPEQQASSYNPTALLKNLNTQHSLYPNHQPPAAEEPSHAPEVPVMEEREELKNLVGTTVLLTLGAQLFLLGIFMLLFSSKGSLTLKWDARHWYYYALVSLPCLFFGYKRLTNKDLSS